jgi:2-polyprenyl-6-hydroxyphenyl methylase / 3-demethylubiquinone-9 3-methyltransferase
MLPNQTIDKEEVSKFHIHANAWWDLSGPFKTLHHLNPVRKALVESYGSVKDKMILDVGCGGGILSESLAYLGAQVTGIDADAASIETATQHAKDLNLNLSYLTTPIETYQAAPVDLITCFEMLEHVTQPQIVIDHAARLLKPDGLLFLSTINRTPRAYLETIVIAEYVLGLLPRQTHDYAKCIRPSELASMVRKAGFEVIQLAGIGYDPLHQEAYLRDSVQVNYVMVARKAISTAP